MAESRTREARLRNAAQRQGLFLRKCLKRDPRSLGYGNWFLIDATTNRPVAGMDAMGDYPVFSLDDIERELAGGRTSR